MVDVSEPGGPVAAIGAGHLLDVDGTGRRRRRAPSGGTSAGAVAGAVHRRAGGRRRRRRGSQDSDWDPVKEAAKKLAFAEDRAVFEGYEAASIAGDSGRFDAALALPPTRRRSST